MAGMAERAGDRPRNSGLLFTSREQEEAWYNRPKGVGYEEFFFQRPPDPPWVQYPEAFNTRRIAAETFYHYPKCLDTKPSRISKQRLKGSWSKLRLRGGRVVKSVINSLGQLHVPEVTSLLYRKKEEPQESDSESISLNSDIIEGLSLNSDIMEALSPRSANVQVKPRTIKENTLAKNVVAKTAVKTKATMSEIRRAKEMVFGEYPPDVVLQPPQKEGGLAVRYNVGTLLGKGGFARCFQGEVQERQPRKHPKIYALKVVKAKMNHEKMESKFRTELQIHSKMRHPNIVEFHRAFTYKQSTYLVLELCSNGSVMDMVKERKCLSLPEVRRLTIQLCGAVKYMHTRNVIHRDLKMGNLFLDSAMNLKLGDFGLAAVLVSPFEWDGLVKQGVLNGSRRTTLCGTPNYIAPEILEKGAKGHDHKVDIWAIGVIIFAMISGYPPFQSASPNEIYRKASKIEFVWPENQDCLNDIPEEAKDLVTSILKVDPDERPDLDTVVSHPFFAMHGGRNIPMIMEEHCRYGKPDWLSDYSPRGDVFYSGHAQWDLEVYAQTCGVGYMLGTSQPYDAVGEDTDLSLYRECFVEETRGTFPIVPLPMDMVYTSEPVPKGPPGPRGIYPPRPISPPISVKTLTTEDSNLERRKFKRLITQPLIYDSTLGIGRPSKLSHAAKLRASHVPAKKSSLESMKSGRALRIPPVRPAVGDGSLPVRKFSSQSSRITRSKKVETVSRLSDPPQGFPELATDQHTTRAYSDPNEARRETAAQTKGRIASNAQTEIGEPPAMDRVSVRNEIVEHPESGKASLQRSISHRSRQVPNSEVQQEKVTRTKGRVVASALQSESSEASDSKKVSVQSTSSHQPRQISKSDTQHERPSRIRARGASAAQSESIKALDNEKGIVQSSLSHRPKQASKSDTQHERATRTKGRAVSSEQGESSTNRRVSSATRSERSERPDSDKASVKSTLSHISGQTSNPDIVSVVIGPDEVSECLPNTKPGEVLDKLKILLSEVNRALHRTGSDYRDAVDLRGVLIKPRPVVTKWVDYTNKFGIGYILSNGTVGCVISGEKNTPSTGVVLAGAEQHFKLRKFGAYSEKHQIVPKYGAPVEFFQTWGTAGLNRVFVPPTDFQVEIDTDGNPMKRRSANNFNQYQKLKKLVLWEKFGLYMIHTLGLSDCEELEASLAEEAKHPGHLGSQNLQVAGPFVKFYQRLGNVGIWGFGDGAFQFNFPDHTKLVVSPDGTWLDLYHLPVIAAQKLKQGTPLTAEDLAGRGVLSYPVDVLLSGVYENLRCEEHDFKDVIKANELEAKVTFVRDVVEEWEKNMGLGSMGSEKKRMRWEGLREAKERMVWVTAGAMWGDEKSVKE